jgi:predicted membrane channel-forming protein YqfA (hemolysin III family)
MAKSTATSDPLYYDVSPEYERYTKFFFMISGLVGIIAIICAVIKAQQEARFYVITLSLLVSIIFVLCIYLFFKRRILLAEKLWFVNLTIFILFLQALIYLIFVFVQPYPLPPVTKPPPIRTTTRHTPTTPNSTNSTNSTNRTTTTPRSTTSTKKFAWEPPIVLTKLYELDET